MIEVRIATIEDAQLLAQLGRRAFMEAFGSQNDPAHMQAYLDLAFDPERIATNLANKDVTFMIASYHAEPVGYAKLVRNYTTPQLPEGDRQMQLERIYALGAFVGRKIGKALMLECIRVAQSEKFDHLWLGVWQENQRAIKFYHDFGFEIIGTKQFIIGETINDDFVMGLKLHRNSN